MLGGCADLANDVLLSQNIHVHILDLSETRKVWEFAEDFKSKHTSLNVLVNHTVATAFCGKTSVHMTICLSISPFVGCDRLTMRGAC